MPKFALLKNNVACADHVPIRWVRGPADPDNGAWAKNLNECAEAVAKYNEIKNGEDWFLFSPSRTAYDGQYNCMSLKSKNGCIKDGNDYSQSNYQPRTHSSDRFPYNLYKINKMRYDF